VRAWQLVALAGGDAMPAETVERGANRAWDARGSPGFDAPRVVLLHSRLADDKTGVP
jgi:hypothetical protein